MKIAYISTHPPRKCGLATFNENLVQAVWSNVNQHNNLNDYYIVAMQDSEDVDEYDYPPEVKFIVRQEQQEDYIKAAQYINNSDADVCLLEHEFGIFGGQSGIYVLPLLHRLKKPLVCVMHTILQHPNYIQKVITKEIAKNCSKIVVMSKRAVEFLENIYDVPREKIEMIEHGVPDFELPVANPFSNITAFKNKKILLTFGLISKNKGLETVVRALPEIVKHYPDVVYVVLGSTHPGVLKSSGESYRNSITLLATQLKVEKHLAFINDFVGEEDLINYLYSADVYITPYLSEAQITSGTLSYAVGCGAAVVSTPYWHAQELLAEERGVLFNFKDSAGLAEAVVELFNNPQKLAGIKRTAFEYGLQLRWSKTGGKYLQLFEEMLAAYEDDRHEGESLINLELMPRLSITHALRLTDDTGIVQHAKYGIPNLKEGYCLDDNARALIMALMAYQQNKNSEAFKVLPIYLSYIHYMQRDDGNFHNFMSFKREYLDDIGSEDSFGRTIWALGFLIFNAPNNSYKEFGEELFFKSLPHCKSLRWLRGQANAIIGLCYYLKTNPYNEEVLGILNNLCKPLLRAYEQHRDDDWHWFEESLTYDNGILPLALLHATEITGDEYVKHVALESLAFLDELTLSNGYLCPVGNDGWYYKGGQLPVFDQQAIEIMAMVLMYLQAYNVTHKSVYIHKMFTSYLWFLGENSLRVPLYDPETKGCCDGLQPNGINRNQGAESTLAYLVSHLTVLEAFEMEYQYKSSLETRTETV
ncbi:glycosyltransferase family 4 protein [Foetidibacter luteolus]|uniref:glycosyltransferase family 4 protein n=1 Tax=Foetidibacter luteolus TaxID=2608880 RepID=UPI00129ABCDA|nr:glycosyltransferase family 4 protein [Foetidibacter luteolus]